MTDNTPGTGRASGGKRPRRTFSPEYKHEAARLVIDTGRTIAEVARELGVGSQSLGTWVAAERATEAGEPTGELTGELTLDERAELKALRRQVAELHKDNEFLGKAAAFFASLANDRRTVRTDDRGEGELRGHSHGATPGSVPVRVLRLGETAGRRTRHTTPCTRRTRCEGPQGLRRVR